ncbi:hypothetical protein [Cohnella hashimotonis]|uniref:Uncharacterized protein n=1 Tax=Cohnella hashimotonis TaxID=2826895 RepID=A0ABT6TTY2_9BACL|nr:hypothetical protein [Cohnella hashimotonis]MDI4649374.1 hypothetical protein [Cohnella hashimotonis]
MVLRIQSKLGGGNKVRLGDRTMLGRDTRTLTDERIEAIAEQVYLAVRRLEAAAVRPSPGLSSSIAGQALPMQPKRSLADRQPRADLRLVLPIRAATEGTANRGAEAEDVKDGIQAKIAPRKARRDLSYPMDAHRMKELRNRKMSDIRQLARLRAGASVQGRLLPNRRRRDVDRQQAEVSTTGPPEAGIDEAALNPTC